MGRTIATRADVTRFNNCYVWALLGSSWVNKRIDAETVEIKIRIRTVVVLDITSTSKLVPFSFLTNNHDKIIPLVDKSRQNDMPYFLCMLRNKLIHCIPNLHNGAYD
jgi:hypothetical protein